jgi:2'-5' RNA ligase
MLKLNRLFFALWPDDAVRRACAEAARELRLKMQPSGYMSNPERYHITLLFLGDTVPPEQEQAAIEAAAAVRAAPFQLNLDSAGSFRNRQVPWWLAPRESPRALAELYESLHEAMMAARVVPDRMKFVPHLTVLRDAHKALPSTAIKPVEWPVRDFVLVRSRLDLQPVRYEIVESWPLKAEPGVSPPGQLGLW